MQSRHFGRTQFITQNSVKQSSTTGARVTDWPTDSADCRGGSLRPSCPQHFTQLLYLTVCCLVKTSTVPPLLHKLCEFYKTQTFAAALTTVPHLMCVSANPTVSPSNFPTKTFTRLHVLFIKNSC